MTEYLCNGCEYLEDRTPENLSCIEGYCKKYCKELTYYDWFERCDECLAEDKQ